MSGVLLVNWGLSLGAAQPARRNRSQNSPQHERLLPGGFATRARRVAGFGIRTKDRLLMNSFQPLCVSAVNIPAEWHPARSGKTILIFAVACAISVIGSISLLTAAVLIH
jgi:hypothetical protein